MNENIVEDENKDTIKKEKKNSNLNDNSENKTSYAPKTGDTIFFFVGLLTISVVGILIIRKLKNKN